MTTPETDNQLAKLARLHPKLIDLSLGRVERLLEALGNPHHRLPPVIHVAGTNGKGSVVAFLKAMLEAAGYRAHVFTSPHLRRFHERIMIAQPGGARTINEDYLSDILKRAEAANAGQPITFFEITTAAAFIAFSESPADIVLLETGLGGRLDATNVIQHPLMTVITPISIDHAEFLGPTIEAIAGEKAGIFKRSRPAVISRQTEAAARVLRERADALRVPVSAAGEVWDAFEQQGRLIFQDETCLIDLPRPRLFGRHQFDNAGTAIAAVRRLHGFEIDEKAIAKGLTNATWPARLERLSYGALHNLTPQGSEIWLDGGHNPAAGAIVANALADLDERVSSPIHLIVGMLSNKDASGFMKPFQGLPELTTTITIPNQPSSYDAEKLSVIAKMAGLSAVPATSLHAALERSATFSNTPVRVMIAGSLYLAGHVLSAHHDSSR